MFSKAWWKSRTLQVNALALLLLGGLDLAQQNIAQLHGLLTPNVYAGIAFALPIVNMFLRAITTQGIHFRTPPDMGAGGKV
jgi:hypothetical protein